MPQILNKNIFFQKTISEKEKKEKNSLD